MTPARRGVSYAVIAAALIAPWEGMDLVAKHQAIDPIGVITWCHGRTNYDDPTVKVGTRFTKADCDRFLVEDIPKYKKPLEKCIRVELSKWEWGAITSGSYNAGAKAMCKSPMVRHFNAGDHKAACNSFMPDIKHHPEQGWYVRANGKFLQGLANRREAERKVCNTPDAA